MANSALALEATGENSDSKEDKSKKPRKRSKRLRAQIQEQMEFYFSDANLQKDRFLKKEISQSEDSYVPLDMFLKFKKIQTLTDDDDDVGMIVKALAKSELLQVNSDKTKVKRKKPLASTSDVDSRTVYVECLPLASDHIWVRNIFQACGPVVYVSLPKYRTTGDIKGFGFVEFEKADGARKACEMLNNPPAHVADKLGRFPKDNKQIRQLERQLRVQKSDAVLESRDPRLVKHIRRQRSVSETAASEDNPRKPNKRSRTTSEGSDGQLQGAASNIAKKLKLNTAAEGRSVPLPSTVSGESSGSSGNSLELGKRKRSSEETEEDKDDSSGPKKVRICTILELGKRKRSSDVFEGEEVKDDSSSAKKVRISEEVHIESSENQKKVRISEEVHVESSENQKKVRISEEVHVQTSENQENKDKRSRKRNRKKKTKEVTKKEVPELRVIPKTEWLLLKKEYLDLQKASMQHLKRTLREQSSANNSKSDTLANNSKPDTPANNSKSGAPTVEEHPANPTSAKTREIDFVPSCIVKVVSSQALYRKELKEAVGSGVDISYIDLKDGMLDGHIRCVTSEAANKLCQSDSKTNSYSLLQGDDEKQYWDKLRADREHKLNSKSKTKHRGRDKIFKRAETVKAASLEKKHIVFSDDD